MKTLPSLFAPVLALALSACSSTATPGSEGNSDRPGSERDDGEHDGRPSGATGSPKGESDELGTFELIANGITSPRQLVVQGGYAYIEIWQAILRVSPDGTVETIAEHDWLTMVSNGREIAWTTPTGIVSAPLSNWTAQTATSISGKFSLAGVDQGYAYITKETSLFRCRVGASTRLEPVVTEAGGPEVTLDGDDVYFFESPNNTALEVRRVPKTGGASVRIAVGAKTGPTASGSRIFLSNTTLFFTTYGGELYAVPRTGGVAVRRIAENSHPVVISNDVVYYASSSDGISRIYKADSKGENPRLIAQIASERGIALSGDETGLYALTLEDEASLYKLILK